MTVREWFRQMRSTEDGVQLACEMDRLLTAPRRIETVYGVGVSMYGDPQDAVFYAHARIWV